MDELEDIQKREIFLQEVLRKLRERFPGSLMQEIGTLRDLSDAAYDVMIEREKNPQ